MQFEQYEKMMIANLNVMSRTAKGIVDTSASSEKKLSMLVESGDEAKRLANENVRNAIRFVYDRRKTDFNDVSSLKNFILETAAIVNKGIVKPEMLLRNGTDSEKYHYVRIADLDYVLDDFCKNLYQMLKENPFDALETACYTEYVVNISAHFFSDGCGKCSMVLSSYMLMRSDLPLVRYKSRSEYYATVEKTSFPEKERYVDEASYRKFHDYFVRLGYWNEI